jgi:hypothetical protein
MNNFFKRKFWVYPEIVRKSEKFQMSIEGGIGGLDA